MLPSGWRDSAWWHDSQVENLERILRRLKRDYNVDENRVSLGGISDGGSGVYFFAMREATPWAHLLSFIGYLPVLRNASLEGQLHLRNLQNRPILSINTDEDRLYPFAMVGPVMKSLQEQRFDVEIREKKGYGHSTRWWPEERAAIDRFVAEHPRDPHPSRIRWATERTDRHHRHQDAEE